MQAPLPMFGNSSNSSNAAITRGSSPHGGQFVKVGDGSSSVSQQLDAYQEHLQAQLQIQQQLWHQQRHLEQMYMLQQQQHQNNLGANPSMFMDQPQMNPFPLMQPTGPSDPETSRNQHPRHYPVLQQDGVSRLTDNALDIELKSMHPLPTTENEKQQAQALEIERHLSEMLFVSGNGHHARGQELGKDSRGTSTAALPTEAIGVLPKEHLSLEEIEAAQFKALQFRQHMEQTPRRSLSELVLPPEVSSTTSFSSSDPKSRGEGSSTNKKDDIPADAAVSAAVPNDSAAEAPNSAVGASGDGEKAGRRFSHLPDHHHHHHHQHRRKASVTHDTTFSIKDTNLFSVPKYDPYRPSQGTFDTITTEMKSLCEELLPNPAEETRKLSLLDRLQELANEVFGKADVLPFGSSGNGLALANADMDLCVFLPKDIKQKSLNGGKQKKEDAEVDKEQQPQDDKSTEEKKEDDQEEAAKEDDEVSPAEFVERMGNRLEEESDFRDILQLKKARVPIVKLVHSPTGIACDIGYENHLALWNTRLLRAYSRIDGRLRELVSVIKYWAKRRKINNPYVVRGILPNLQTITADNSGRIPFWDCQGFNRYFFEDVSDLDSHWRPTTESQRETVGELLYEFFRYFVHEFRYATQVVSIRKGGLLTKDQKEWSKEFLQAENRPPSSVRSRYLFCIEDPFEVDHNVARTVDRYTLFAIRGEFMRAAKVLSRGGDNIIARLCQEKEDPPPSEEGTSHHNDDASATPGEGDEDGGGGRDDQVDDGSSAKHSRPTAFPEGDEPIRANNNGGSGSARSGRDSHYGGGKRVSSTPRDGQHHHHGNHHQNQSRLSFQQQARQHYHHNNNQSQRDSLRRASLAGGAHGSSSRDRSRQ
ncbi:hypothetical protein BGW42_001292 [Actinomortierella wolfii]|nr:hypothetical protein BGW42_001292 [Actinomortierella wolfii]